MIKESISLLGLKAHDRVTGFSGVIASISFDLYGCVQALIQAPVTIRDMELGKAYWFDVKRLEIDDRVMNAPNFEIKFGKEIGAAEKPVPHI